MPQSNKFQYDYNSFYSFLDPTIGMITNQKRNKKYKEWIDSVDVKGKTVLDAGAGLGLWGHYILQKGAKKIIQVETDYTRYSFLQHLKKKSKFNSKIEIINANLLSNFKCDRPDIIISEFIGTNLLNEKIHIILSHLKTRWPNASFIFEYGQYEIIWSALSVDCLKEYFKTAEKIKDYSYVEPIEMPNYWTNCINELYRSFQLPINSRVDPKNFVEQAFYKEKGKVFSFCKKNNIIFEINSKIPKGYENKKVFATLILNIGIEMSNLTPSWTLGLPCGISSLKQNNKTYVNFKYDEQQDSWITDWK